MKRCLTVFTLLLLAVLMANPGYCSTVNGASGYSIGSGSDDPTPPVPGLWYEFLFGGVGSQGEGCFGSCVTSSGGNSTDAQNPPWTYTTTAPSILYVTDAFSAGDAFDVYDNGNLVLATPMVSASGFNCGSNPVDCYGNPNMSYGSVILPAGSNSITIFVTASPYGEGAAYFSPELAAEPSTFTLALLMMALPFLGIPFRRRRWN